MILDRTCWTLAAHSFALASVGGVDSIRLVRERGNLAGLFPEHLIYLDVSHDAQLQRAQIRGQLPEPLLNRDFNIAFRQYLIETETYHSAVRVNADSSITDVASKTQSQIFRWLVHGNR